MIIVRLSALIILTLVSSVIVSSAQSEVFKIDNQNVSFVWLKDRHITISANCVVAGNLKNCEAKRAMDRADLSKLDRELFGRNPGALLCSQQLGGTVVWSKDAKGNERTFCQFSDGSFVGSGSLAYYGRRGLK